MKTKLACLALLLSLSLAACATEHPPGTGPSAAAPAAGGAQEAAFRAWVRDLRPEALRSGVSARTFDRAFANVRYNPEILGKDQDQPEFVRPVWEYLDRAVSPERVANGRMLLAQNRPVLQQVAQRYGVPPSTLVAIWGMESNYGAVTGDYNVIEALATLAYGSGRKDFFRSQLLDALRILEAGDIAPERMKGSWAGAMGQTQFMPEAFRTHAVDFDGDRRRDIWGSLPDVLASTGNYLHSFGWNPAEPWGAEVRLPANFPYELAEASTKKTVAEWQRLGVHAAGSRPLPPPATLASILLPAGYTGPAFLVTENFARIMKYNASTSYALAVGHLSDRIDGMGAIQASWPTHEPPLSRADRMQLQQLLTQLGYDTGGVDGVIGAKTRAALRAFQKDSGLPADGFATASMLERLRARAAVT